MLVGLLLTSARADTPPETNADWRRRQIALKESFHRDPLATRQAAVTALEAATSAQDTRRGLWAVQAYLSTFSDSPPQLDCDQGLAAIRRAESLGPSYRTELFDLIVVMGDVVERCRMPVRLKELQVLAETLGDPLRQYFLEEFTALDLMRQDRYVLAAQHYARAAEYAPSDVMRAQALTTQSSALRAGGNAFPPALRQAREVLKQAQSHIDAERFPRLMAKAVAAAGRVEMNLGLLDEAMASLRHAIEISTANGIPLHDYTNALAHAWLAMALNRAGKPREALAVLDQVSPHLKDRLALQPFVAQQYFVALSASKDSRDRERAETWLKEARRMLRELPSRAAHLEDLYANEAVYFENIGNFQGALEALKRANEAATQRQQRASERDRLELQEQLNVKAKEQENAELKAREAELEQRRVVLGAALGLALVVLLAIAELLRRRSAQQRRLAELASRLEQANADLSTANQRLNEHNQSRTQLLAAACHDLRQPAHALGMLVELGRDTQPGEVGFEPWLNQVGRCTTVLSDMLGELMDLGSLEGGAYKPSPTDVDLAELLHDVVLNFAPTARRKGLALEAPPVSLAVHSDRHLLRRILFNLVSNAVKYTEHGHVQVQVREAGEQVEIRVADTGPGIPPERLGDVLRDYVRLDNSHATDGLGIGLAVVRRAAELLNHELTLASNLGQGTTATLRLPRAHGRAAAVTDSTAGIPQASDAFLRGLVVALMEDDPEVRDAVSAVLRRWGCTVVAAEDAKGVLQGLQASLLAPGLVMTDMNLSGADGLEELATLRQTLHDPTLPALVVTGDLDASVAARAAQQRAFVAHKPLGPAKLHRLLRQLARWPQPQTAATGAG